MTITEFRGAYRWLSNFWPSPVLLEGESYPTVENAYQAAKTAPANRPQFIACSPGKAKRLGSRVPIRPEWEEEKVTIMRGLLSQKFTDPELAKKLIETDGLELIEGNTWGDYFWGVCDGSGQNRLGKLLMELRNMLKQNVHHGSQS